MYPQSWSQSTFLMHHYSIYTSPTLPFFTRTRKNFWLSDIPLFAAECPPLMHGVLAFAALHLAHLQPQESKWKTLALRHQNMAMRLLIPMLEAINAQNVMTITALSVMLGASSHGITTCQTSPSPFCDVLEVYGVSRAIGRAINAFKPVIRQGPMPQMIGTWKARSPLFRLPPYEEQRFNLLHSLNSYNESESPLLHASIKSAINSLKELYMDLASWQAAKSKFVIVLWMWPVDVDDQYVALLSQKDPVALVILAQFIILSHVVDTPWYMAGWTERALDSIKSVIPPELWYLLEWPDDTIEPLLRMIEIEVEPRAVEIDIRPVTNGTELQRVTHRIEGGPGVMSGLSIFST